MSRKWLSVLGTLVLLSGCTGMQRGCSSWVAENAGSDWLIVQYGFDGTPINAWKLNDVSVANEESSDGIYWKDNVTGHLIHISGWYNRVQVSGEGRFEDAARLLGVDLARVNNGRYIP